jgi:hypothetical protein
MRISWYSENYHIQMVITTAAFDRTKDDSSLDKKKRDHRFRSVSRFVFVERPRVELFGGGINVFCERSNP